MSTDSKEFMRQRDAVMVRRLKSELPKDDFRQDRFPKRVLEALEVDYPDEEKRIHAALRDYAARRQARRRDNAERFATDFVLMTLKKRLFSSPAAFLRTLEQHENSLRTARKRQGVSRPTRGILQRQIDRVEEEYAVDEEADEAAHEALDAASLLFQEPSTEEWALLKEMKSWAAKACLAARRQDQAADRLAQRAHPAQRFLERSAGHHLHRVPAHPELAPGCSGL